MTHILHPAMTLRIGMTVPSTVTVLDAKQEGNITVTVLLRLPLKTSVLLIRKRAAATTMTSLMSNGKIDPNSQINCLNLFPRIKSIISSAGELRELNIVYFSRSLIFTLTLITIGTFTMMRS